jgi:hypothetical protein
MARLNNRLPTSAQAINITKPTAASTKIRVNLYFWSGMSRHGVTTIFKPE